MAKRTEAKSGFDDEPNGEAASAPVAGALGSKANDKKDPLDRSDDREDGVYDGIMVYGRIKYNPFCPRCTDPSKGKYVMTKVTSTQGPLAHVKCPTEGCTFTTKASRPQDRAMDIYRRQQSFAARSDMG